MNMEIKVGDKVEDTEGYVGIVVEITKFTDIEGEDTGVISVWQMNRTSYGIDNCEHYSYKNWQKFLKIRD